MSDTVSAQPLRAKSARTWALIVKETRQLVRDPSSLALGVALPLILIVLFGYGLSLDVKNVPIAVVAEDTSADAMDVVSAFWLSPYFKIELLHSMHEADELMLQRRVDGVVRLRSDFSRQLKAGDGEIQLLLHGSDANRARIIQNYAQGAIGAWSQRQQSEGRSAAMVPVTVQSRVWFNETNESRYFLVPGLIVLVMTLIGAMLTAMVMAREWERGTIEALFVTPVRSEEILLGKTIPYFVLGMVGLGLCVLAAEFMFHVPLRGSLLVLIACSMLYVLVAVGIGLLISSAVKNQLLASQFALLITYMPALMLSGFLFDLRSMPTAIRVLTYVLPARYYVTLLQTVFLTGDVWSVILPNAAVLAVMATIFLVASRLVTQKRLD